MKLRIRCTVAGVEHTATVTPWVWCLWERRTKRRISDLAGGMGLEDMAYLAWEAIRIAAPSEIPPTFDSFLQRLEEIEPVDDGDLEGPTRPALSAD